MVGIDPGKLYSGVGVQTPRATLWMGHLVLPFSTVKKAMESRRRLRRFRRCRKTPASHFLHYGPYETATEHGQRWEGTCHITPAPFAIVQRPLWYRRALHDQNPTQGGRRKRHGGTTTPWGFRKGDWVEATKAGQTVRGYVSGYTKTATTQQIAIVNTQLRRLGKFVVSHVRLLRRSTRLLVEAMPSTHL